MNRSAIVLALGLLSFAFCGGTFAAQHHHEAKPPHGGALIVLAEEVAHLELVLDPKAGKLTAYVLDGEAEKFIRLKQNEIELRVSLAETKKDGPLPVKLKPVASVLTGETEGDTSQFEGSLEQLKGAKRFTGVVVAVTVRGKEFRDVPFKFPEGNE